jgi:hypothetical protein
MGKVQMTLHGESSDDTIARWGTAKLISLSVGLKFPFSVFPTTTWPFALMENR